MKQALEALAWALVHSLWQLALLGIVAALALRVAGGRRPKIQYLIAFTALGACLVWPLLTLLHGLGAQAAPAGLPGPGPLNLAATVAVTSQTAPVVTWGERATAFLASHLGWVVGAWTLGVFVMAVRMGGGWLATLAWQRTAVAPPEPWPGRCRSLVRTLGVSGRVLLLASTRVATPMVMGLWRPVVLVPAALFTRLPEAYLEALLAHELAHIARWDYGFNLLQSLIEVLCFHHPVVWWLSRRVRTLREHLCDDLAAKAIGEPRRLALALDALDDVQPLLNPMALAAGGGPLFERIQRLVRPQILPGAPGWALAPMLALLAPFAAFAVRAQDAPPIAIQPESVAQIDALAAQEGLDPQLLRSIAWAESGFNPKAKSPLGALGILQVMPETAKKYGATDLSDPKQVAASGAHYLKFLLERYQGDVAKAVAAYNCGHEALDAGQIGAETVGYRALVLDLFQAKAVQPAAPLGEGAVEGTLRLQGNGEVWTADMRFSARGGCDLELLPEPVAGQQAPAYGKITTGSTDAKLGPWRASHPVLMVKIPRGATIRVRCTDPVLGITGETRVKLDNTWKTFAFRMEPRRK